MGFPADKELIMGLLTAHRPAGLTPVQWLAIIQEIAALILHFLNPPTPTPPPPTPPPIPPSRDEILGHLARIFSEGKLTPTQWLLIIQEIAALVLQFLQPTPPASLVDRRPTGAIPTPRHLLASSTPFRPSAVAIPDTWCAVPAQLSYWLNNQYGDCVTAEEAFAKAVWYLYPGVGGSELMISDAVVKAWCQSHGVLNGANLPPVMDSMAQDGITGPDGKIYTDGAYHSVDYTNDAILRAAIYQGPVKLGVAAGQLQNVVGQSNGWIAWNFQPDSNEDHCTSLSGYGTLAQLCQSFGVQVPSGANSSEPSYAFFTWSTVGIITQTSLLNITGEAWLRVPTTPQQPPTPVPTPPPVPTPVPTPNPNPVPPSPVPPTPTPAPTGPATFATTAADGSSLTVTVSPAPARR